MKKVAVVGLVFVTVASAFLMSGTLVYTDRGWSGKVGNSWLHYFDGGQPGTHDYYVDAEADGVPSSFNLTAPLSMGVPDSYKIRVFDIDSGDSTMSGQFNVYFGTARFGTVTPIQSVGGEPRYRFEVSRSASFDSSDVDILSPQHRSGVVLSKASWWMRIARFDSEVGQWRDPSPAIEFQAVQPPPPPQSNLIAASWTGDHTIFFDFADTVGTLASGEIRLLVNGLEIGSSSSPIAESCCRWRQWRGTGARIPGSWLAIVQGDSLAWVEQ